MLLYPQNRQLDLARMPSPHDSQARQWLAEGVRLDAQTPVMICRAHQVQVQDLRAWSNTPAGSYFGALVPSAPEVFRETVTRETSMLPICVECAIRESAVLVTRNAAGQLIHELQLVDTCNCASNIAGVTPVLDADGNTTYNPGQGCSFCELGRIETAKQIAVKKRAAKTPEGLPVLIPHTNHQALACACGRLAQLPEVVRKCVGCDGVQTVLFSNFAGDRVNFLEASEQVKEFIDIATGQPILAQRSGNGIPQSVPQHQLPAVNGGGMANGMNQYPQPPQHGVGPAATMNNGAGRHTALSSAAVGNGLGMADLDLADAQSLNKDDPQDQLRDITQHGRLQGKKRGVQEAFGPASPGQEERRHTEAQRQHHISKPPKGQVALFVGPSVATIAALGLKVFFNYHNKDIAMTGARRAEILLNDNLDCWLNDHGIVVVMFQCGVDKQIGLTLSREVARVHAQFQNGFATGAQVLTAMRATGMLPHAGPPAISVVPSGANGQTQTMSQQQPAASYPLFDSQETNALMKLGFKVRMNAQAAGSNVGAAQRAKILLTDQTAGKMPIDLLIVILRICGAEDSQVEGFAYDLSNEGSRRDVTIAEVLQRMSGNGMLAAAALPAPPAMAMNGNAEAGSANQQQDENEFAGIQDFIDDATLTMDNLPNLPEPELASEYRDIESTLRLPQQKASQPTQRATHSALPAPTATQEAPPAHQPALAFSPQDVSNLKGLGLKSVPELSGSLTPGQRAKALFKANLKRGRPSDLGFIFEICGYDAKVANQMVKDVDEVYDDEPTCRDILDFFEGDFARG